jgi:hypothetical protein
MDVRNVFVFFMMVLAFTFHDGLNFSTVFTFFTQKQLLGLYILVLFAGAALLQVIIF